MGGGGLSDSRTAHALGSVSQLYCLSLALNHVNGAQNPVHVSYVTYALKM